MDGLIYEQLSTARFSRANQIYPGPSPFTNFITYFLEADGRVLPNIAGTSTVKQRYDPSRCPVSYAIYRSGKEI